MNGNYGHRAILATAADMDTERPILGLVQHGWTPYDGWARYHRLPRYWTRFVWSSRALTRKPHGRPPARYTVVGSPFAYLMKGRLGQNLKPRIASGTVAFPQHSAENVRVDTGHEGYAKALIEREGHPVTVCLYWLDFNNDQVRQTYENLGHRVVTVGTSRNDRLFIPRYLRILDGHSRVVSNRVSTALMYAAALDYEASTYGIPFSVNAKTEKGTEEAADALALLRPYSVPATDSWGEVTMPRDWARSELGWDEILPAERLSRVLGWSGLRKYLAPSVLTITDIARLARTTRFRRHSSNKDPAS